MFDSTGRAGSMGCSWDISSVVGGASPSPASFGSPSLVSAAGADSAGAGSSAAAA